MFERGRGGGGGETIDQYWANVTSSQCSAEVNQMSYSVFHHHDHGNEMTSVYVGNLQTSHMTDGHMIYK